MIVLERLTLFGLLRLARLRSASPARRAVLLNAGPAGRLAARVFGVELLPDTHRGRDRALAFLLAIPVTEALLRKGKEDAGAQRALLAFFGTDEILQAYRKFLLQYSIEAITDWQAALYEALKAGCEAITCLPIGPQSAALLDCWRRLQQDAKADAIEIIEDRAGSIASGFYGSLYGGVAGLALLAQWLGRLLHQGLCLRAPRPSRYLVGLHGYWNVASGRPWDLRSADFLVDGTRVRREDLLLLLSRGGNTDERMRQYREAGFAFVLLSGLRAPAAYAVRLVPRLLKAAACLCLPSRSVHPLLRRRAAGAILYGISLEVLLQHYRLGVLLNADEDSYEAVVETAVLNKFGGATSWIPHTVVGGLFTMAYLHFDLLPLQGWFHAENCGETWNKRMRVRPVGMATNDRPGDAEASLASDAVRRLVEGFRGNGPVKILGAFTGSYTPDTFVQERYRRFLRALALLAERAASLRIIIKPKATEEWPEHAYFLSEEPFRSTIQAGVQNGRITVLDPRAGLTCSAQYLMSLSDTVLSTAQHAAFGSVWVEALLLGKPSYVFAPSEFRSAPFAGKFFDRWIFDHEERLAVVVTDSLTTPGKGEVDGMIAHLFDPFNDGRALERMRSEILAVVPSEFHAANEAAC
ncbi:MAG: hypothetical protein EPO61_01165 [Nitrospirae bacterium]|nr:MAG: hypothetical protein EPO61_01165 [Nitrospirota bacterium]